MAEITIGNNVLSHDELDLIHSCLHVIEAGYENEDHENTGFVLQVLRLLIPRPNTERPSRQDVNEALLDLHNTLKRVMTDY